MRGWQSERSVSYHRGLKLYRVKSYERSYSEITSNGLEGTLNAKRLIKTYKRYYLALDCWDKLVSLSWKRWKEADPTGGNRRLRPNVGFTYWCTLQSGKGHSSWVLNFGSKSSAKTKKTTNASNAKVGLTTTYVSIRHCSYYTDQLTAQEAVF